MRHDERSEPLVVFTHTHLHTKQPKQQQTRTQDRKAAAGRGWEKDKKNVKRKQFNKGKRRTKGQR